MSKSHDVFLYLGTYDSEPAAEEDLQQVKRLHSEGLIGTYDAAVVFKKNGRVRMHKIEKPTLRGMWTGLVVGAALGTLFPKALAGTALPGTALAGAAGGGLLAHFAKGMSRRDIRDLGATLDSGEAALVVVGRDRLTEQREKVALRAHREMERELDISGRDLDRALSIALDS